MKKAIVENRVVDVIGERRDKAVEKNTCKKCRKRSKMWEEEVEDVTELGEGEKLFWEAERHTFYFAVRR